MPTRYHQIGSIKSFFDETIDRHAEAYINAYPEITEFSNFSKSGTINYYIGMVWTNDYERIDTTQVRIRGSMSITKNKMVELDLSNVDQLYSFFPGQIVAFSAEPFVRRQLTVKKFLDPMRIAPQMKQINTDDKINLIIASGPYMEIEHEDWTLIDKLIENIKFEQASHIIMIGPFVDIENKAVKSQYDSIWKLFFGRILEGLYDHECQIFLVPSLRDILPANLRSNYFYPISNLTIDINLRDDVIPKCHIKSVYDPSQIDLGGIYLDVTSAEVLFHLHKCTSFINRGPSNLFNSLFRHTITHGIYPIYPAPALEMPIDYTNLASNIKLDRLGPHIIVLPTRFNTAVNNVENRVVVTIHKCSVKKHCVFIEIPKIESTYEEPVNSLFNVDFNHKIITLIEAPLAIKMEEIKQEPEEVKEMALPSIKVESNVVGDEYNDSAIKIEDNKALKKEALAIVCPKKEEEQDSSDNNKKEEDEDSERKTTTEKNSTDSTPMEVVDQ